MPTDTERLDFLQQLTDESHYSGYVILRKSTTDRGWRLHETRASESVHFVRDAIDNFMINSKEED